MPTPATRSDAGEAQRVHDWRVHVCLGLGYSIASAERIAASSADLHVLAKLIEGGCSKRVAKRIVV